MHKLSVIVPCYNEQEVLMEFYGQVKDVLNSIEELDYELLFIDPFFFYFFWTLASEMVLSTLREGLPWKQSHRQI